jgi:hypothetical protein
LIARTCGYFTLESSHVRKSGYPPKLSVNADIPVREKLFAETSVDNLGDILRMGICLY